MAVTNAQTPKAFINVRSAGFLKIGDLTDDATTYEETLLARGIKSVSADSVGEIVTANADGMEIESARSPGEATLSLLMHEFSPDVRAMLFNETKDANGLSKDELNRQNAEVAFFFVHERKDGSFKLYFYPRVVFNDPGLEANQRSGGTVEFTEETSEGRVLYTFHDQARKYTLDTRTSDNNVRGALEDILGAEFEGIDQIETYITKEDPEVIA